MQGDSERKKKKKIVNPPQLVKLVISHGSVGLDRADRNDVARNVHQSGVDGKGIAGGREGSRWFAICVIEL